MGGARHLGVQLVPHVSHFTACALDALRPQLGTRFGIDQLHGDAQSITTPAHGSLDHVDYTKLASNLPHVGEAALVSESRLPCDDKEVADAGESRRDLLDHTIDKVVVPPAAKIVEGHDH